MTRVDGHSLKQSGVKVLKHQMIFTVGDRSFRWEYPKDSNFIQGSAKKSPKSPLSPKNNKTKKGRSPRVAVTPGKRVSFGPYISPEYIDKTLPPSTPVRKGQAPSSEASTPRATASTPSTLLKHSLKKKISKQPLNVSQNVRLKMKKQYRDPFVSGLHI